MKTLLVLINSASGRADEEGCDAVQADLERHMPADVEARFVVGKALDLMQEARNAKTDYIATAGGDGTIAAVGSVLFARDDQPIFIPLPYGTANLIPRDLGMPLSPHDALPRALSAPVRMIDFAMAGDLGLLHSAAFGTFADIAQGRETLRDAPTFGDAVGAALDMFDHFVATENYPYELTVDGETRRIETSAIFVTNNAITHGMQGTPRRSNLDRGELVIYVSRSAGMMGLVQHVLEAIGGRFDKSADFLRLTGRQVCVKSLGHELHYTIDGEPSEAPSELSITMYPSSLKVCDLR